MKVSLKNFPRLSKESALLVIAETKTAKLYQLQNGILKLAGAVSQPRVGVRRQKGRFEYRFKGNLMGSGEVLNAYSVEERRRFITVVSNTVNGLHFQYDRVFLFAPSSILNALYKGLPEKARRRVTRKFPGNYAKFHETKLLALVKERRRETKKKLVRPIKKEALKLLKRKRWR